MAGIKPTNRTASSTSTKKRAVESNSSDEAPAKIQKVFPIFAKPSEHAVDGAFQWIKPALGPKRTCMHGVHLTPKASKSVAVFDLDGTVIKSQFAGRKRVKGGGPHEWHWWRDVVPKKLKEAHESGMSVVLISNQAIKQLDDWKMKIPRIAKALPGVPFRIFAATAKDGYRKPMPGMWYELEKIFRAEGVEIDKSTSFYVGDAAGRADDFASTDRKFAQNVGIQFYTPEEYFLKLPKAPYKLPGFNVSSLKPSAKPSEAHIVPPSSKPEIVLFVGMPCLGKSSAYRKYFSPKGYVHISQDALGSRAKCVKATEEALSRGKSCVIDNTNRDRSTRKFYIDLAKRLKTPVRCLLFEGSQELAWHNNLYRAYNLPPSAAEREPKRDLVPYLAFATFSSNYEEPKLDEGFSAIVKMPWVFEGDEEEQRHWSMWLQIEGK